MSDSDRMGARSRIRGSLGPTTAFLKLPLRFMVVGILAFIAVVTGLGLRPELLSTYHYNQYVIAATHLFVLGWLLSVVMGAMYQLVPVALESRLYSERLARLHFYFHLVGFTGMVLMFWRWNMAQVAHFASVLAFGVALFLYNLVRTLIRVPKWNVVATAVCCALAWLSLTVVAGLTITAGKCTYELSSTDTSGFSTVLAGLRQVGRFAGKFDAIGAMHAHAHLGVVGLFILLLVGVSYRLVPMFTLSEVQSSLRAGVSVVFINAGLAGSFFTIVSRNPLKLLFAVMLAGGIVVYIWEILAILRARSRRALDWGLKTFLTGVALLGPVCLLGVVLSWPGLPLTALTGQLENLYGFLGLTGVLSLAVTGMLYKIIPFLVWQTTYSGQVGLRKVPALADLYAPRLQVWGYWTYVFGLLLVTAGILPGNASIVRCGAAALGASLLLLGTNVAQMLSHLYKPGPSSAHLSQAVMPPRIAVAK